MAPDWRISATSIHITVVNGNTLVSIFFTDSLEHLDGNLGFCLFFIPCILPLLQNLLPTLPTMQLDHWHVWSEIRVCYACSGRASSLQQRWAASYRGLVNFLIPHLQIFFHFQIEAMYRTSPSSLWRQKCCSLLFFTYAVVLSNT